MSRMIAKIGMVVGAVALIATGVGAVAGGAIIGATVGAVGPVAVTLGSVTSTIATYAGLAAGALSLGAQLTYKPPPARGSITQLLIAVDPPQPYVMGEGYVAGVLRYQRSYGPTLKKVPNPYRWKVVVYSGGGPIESITPYVDQGAISSWYAGYLTTSTQLGACPEAGALNPGFAVAPDWDSASKLSGQAAIGWNLKFDKDGKRYASGEPQLGAYGKWVKCYDPRLDSTFPGGSGPHRLGDETTYAWTQSPALHAGTYAFGRYQNGKRTIGVGLPAAAIDWASVAAWANVCDANDWTIFGAVYEPMPDTRWPNLKDICAAGAGRPIIAGGVLSFHYAAPRVVLDTFTEADLAEGPGSVTAMKGRRERLNTIVPKYRDPAQNWELVPLATPVSDAGYVAADGEERKAEWPFNLVKDKDQAAQLAAYVLTDSREMQPITLTFGVRVRDFKPGACVHLTIPALALDHDAVILTKEFNPAAMTTTFGFMTENPDKHAFALGRTGTAPPTPGLRPTGQQRDEMASTLVDINADGLDAWLSPAVLFVPADMNGAVTSYTPATGSFIIKTTDGTDVSASFTLSTPAGGDPNGLTESYFLRTFSIFGGIAASSSEDQTTLVIQATGSGDFAGVQLQRRLTVIKDYGGVLLPVAVNYNTDNDGNGLTPPAATGVTISSTTYTDSTASLEMEWTYSHSTSQGVANNIDGHEPGFYLTSSPSGYTYSSADDGLIRWGPKLPADRRGWRLNGVPANLHATAVVRPYRIVRSNVDPDRIIYGPVAQSSSVTPHQPSPTPNFTNRIDGETAANVKDGTGRALVAITAGGGAIATGKVLTGSLADGAINMADWAAQSADIALGTSDAFASTYLDIDSTGSHLRAQFAIDYQVSVNNPNQGDEFSFTVKIWAERVAGGADTYSDTLTVTEVWNAPSASGIQTFARDSIMFEYPFEGLAGSVATPAAYSLGYLIETDANTSGHCRAYRYIRGSDERASQ